ncbi:MAG: hypothetical protein LRY73_16515 [Bacillus sp. (in: Bacteria)]|nr:hypothetical protein [Bacillus sp. (in: firmicutes)]
MDKKTQVTLTKKGIEKSGSGFKVVKVEVKDPSDSIYAVCTPVKWQ